MVVNASVAGEAEARTVVQRVRATEAAGNDVMRVKTLAFDVASFAAALAPLSDGLAEGDLVGGLWLAFASGAAGHLARSSSMASAAT